MADLSPTRSPLWRSGFASSACIPMALDKATHDRVLNWAAVMMWPQFSSEIRKQVGNSIIKRQADNG